MEVQLLKFTWYDFRVWSLVLTLQTLLPNFSVLPKQVSLLLKQFKELDNSCLFLYHCIALAAQGFR